MNLNIFFKLDFRLGSLLNLVSRSISRVSRRGPRFDAEDVESGASVPHESSKDVMEMKGRGRPSKNVSVIQLTCVRCLIKIRHTSHIYEIMILFFYNLRSQFLAIQNLLLQLNPRYGNLMRYITNY